MSIKDHRTNTFNPMKSDLVFATNFKIDESSIKVMLQFMGIKPTKEMIQEAIGFLSQNAMEMNMTNLYSFIVEKGYDKKRLDLREKKN